MWSHQTHTQPRFRLHRKKIRLPLVSLECWLQGPQGSKSSGSLAKMTLCLHITHAILLYTLLCVCMCAYRLVHVSAGAERGKQYNVYRSFTLHFMTPWQGLLLNLELAWLPTTPRNPPVSASLSTGVIGGGVTRNLAFYVGDGSSCLCSKHFTPGDSQGHPASEIITILLLYLIQWNYPARSCYLGNDKENDLCVQYRCSMLKSTFINYLRTSYNIFELHPCPLLFLTPPRSIPLPPNFTSPFLSSILNH